jgi:hypothetical protein
VTPAALPQPSQIIHRIAFPEEAKKTEMISGSATEAAQALVAKLRDEARVIER